MAFVEKAHRDDIGNEARRGDAQQDARLHLGRLTHAAYRLHHNCSGDDEEGRPVDQRRENLDAEVAIGLLRSRGTPRDARREQRQPDRRHVRQHVPRICQQSERVGQHPANQLRQHEHGGDQQHGLQRARVRLGERRAVNAPDVRHRPGGGFHALTALLPRWVTGRRT